MAPVAPPVAEADAEPQAQVDEVPKAVTRRKRLVLLARTTLIMLFVAGLVILGLGVASLLLVDPPEVDGWLRYIFGRVPALAETPRRIFAAVAGVTIAITAIVLLVTGSVATILNLGLLGIVGLACFGLAGATSFSPHRFRAIVSGVALVLVALGSLWVLVNAFIRPPVGG